MSNSVPSAPRKGCGGHRGGRRRFGIRGDDPMKFENDFDFENANVQFNNEEIDREFHNKLKLKEDKLERQEKPVNGEDKGDSGVETQNSEGNADEEDPLGPNCYYDKTKSFFSNISCDDNRERRPTWTEEGRLNAETCGSCFIQTVAMEATETEEALASVVAEVMAVAEEEENSLPLEGFMLDSEVLMRVGSFQILNIGKPWLLDPKRSGLVILLSERKTTKLLHSLQTSLKIGES